MGLEMRTSPARFFSSLQTAMALVVDSRATTSWGPRVSAKSLRSLGSVAILSLWTEPSGRWRATSVHTLWTSSPT